MFSIFKSFSWIEYFAKFPTIKKFNGTVTSTTSIAAPIEVETLQSLAKQLPQLMELGFHPNENLTIKNLYEFFETNKNLEKIFLVISESFPYDLYKEIKDEFNIPMYRIYGVNVMTIKRK